MPPASDHPVIETLRATLAGLAAFQAWAGAASEEEALARIHVDFLPRAVGDHYRRDEAEALRPLALIWQDEEEWQRAAPYGDAWAGSGRLAVRLEQNCPVDQWDGEAPSAEADAAWRKTVAELQRALCAAAAATCFTRVSRANRDIYCGDRDEIDSYGLYQAAILRVAYDGDVA